ncbi:MAG: threonine synthase [Bacteroidales bacterium]|nr:threonine synthase [Bacteroidales bacterium]
MNNCPKPSYIGTRDFDEERNIFPRVSFADAILNPIASFGGLYVPDRIPKFSSGFLKRALNMSYKELVFRVLEAYNANFDQNAISTALKAYENFAYPKNPVPVTVLNNGLYVQELYHGSTGAFKDAALSVFPKFLGSIAAARNINLLVMVATSGDTGPASNHGFAEVDNIKSFCMYPHGGTSEVQRLQMVTENASNIEVVGIEGNFDDAQNALKKILASDDFKEELKSKGYQVSAANSVNFGRIVLQIVYHIWGYLELVRKGEITLGDEITSVIPSGNFGNALACYYAKEMGLPIKKIVLASNENNILTSLIRTGCYDLNDREFKHTNSPAMDILISSNIERILYHFYGAARTKELMQDLKNEKMFCLSDDEYEQFSIFNADFATDEDVLDRIAYVYDKYDYIIDPHTATAFVVMEKIGLDGHVMISSTAHWTKFSSAMAKAFDIEDSLETIAAHIGATIPKQIAELSAKEVIHTKVIPIQDIENEVLNFLD